MFIWISQLNNAHQQRFNNTKVPDLVNSILQLVGIV